MTQPLLTTTTRAGWYVDCALLLERLGVQTWADQRVLDIGAADGAFLEAIASAGAEASGLEKASIQVSAAETRGVFRMFRGDTAQIDGETFDLIVSRNTLKKGFIRPDTGSPMIRLGATIEQTLSSISNAMQEDALFCIFNVSPTDQASASQPHADGRCPFTVAELEHHGFEVLLFDENLTALTKACARAVGVDALSTGVTTLCTVVRKIPT